MTRLWFFMPMVLSGTIPFEGLLPGWMYHAQLPSPEHFKGGERNYFDLFIDGELLEVLHAKGDTVAVIKGV